jgi:hypothetical protein
MAAAQDALARARPGMRATCLAVFGAPEGAAEGVACLETVPEPRIFEWNLMHHVFLEKSCVDLDAVLFGRTVPADQSILPFLPYFDARHRPTRTIHTILTSLRESDRGAAEQWLSAQGIAHKFLVMRGNGVRDDYRSFKAAYYRRTETHLLIDGDEEEAVALAAAAGKPVLSMRALRMVEPRPVAAPP